MNSYQNLLSHVLIDSKSIEKKSETFNFLIFSHYFLNFALCFGSTIYLKKC